MNRRRLLRVLGTIGVSGLAGCNALGGRESTPTETPTTGDQKRATGTGTSADTLTQTTTTTQTLTPDQPPRIVSQTATPKENGQALAFSIEAEDDNNLDSIVVSYGDETWARDDIDGARIDEQGTFTDLTGDNPDDGRVLFVAHDATGEKARADITPDDTAPTLSTYSVEPTETAGELTVRLEASDDTGLDGASIEIGDRTPAQRSLTGESSVSTDRTVSVSEAREPGVLNRVTGSVEDWNGNSRERDTETYVRKYDVMEETRLNIAAGYMIFMGGAFQNDCLSGIEAEPTIGQYWSGDNWPYVISPGTMSRHVDQMTGHGINRLWLNFDGTDKDRKELESVLRSDLLDQIQITPSYSIKNYRWSPDDEERDWKNDLVPTDMSYMKAKLLTHPNMATHDGRPIVRLWGQTKWANKYTDVDYRGRILDAWGSYANFIADLRSQLAVDGTEPFLIATYTYHGHSGYHGGLAAIAKEMDGIVTWTKRGGDNVSMDEALPWIEENFKGHRAFTDEHDLEFIPAVFPGFNHRDNSCWGSNGYTPRDIDAFERFLKLADRFRTTDMIDIVTWNDWTEGTQIEPGSYKGTDYGTAYVEVIEEFQREADE